MQNKNFIVEGVGSSIYLVDDSEILTSDDNKPDYYVMERGALDGNSWSLRNRWFHRSVVSTLKNKTLYLVKNNDNNIIYYTNVPSDEADFDTMIYEDKSLLKPFGKLKELQSESNFSNMFDDTESKMFDYYDLSNRKKGPKKNKEKPTESSFDL